MVSTGRPIGIAGRGWLWRLRAGGKMVEAFKSRLSVSEKNSDTLERLVNPEIKLCAAQLVELARGAFFHIPPLME